MFEFIKIIMAGRRRLARLREEAFDGNAEAAARLGDHYFAESIDQLLGGGPRARTEALGWYRKAADLNEPELRRQRTRLEKIKAHEPWRVTDGDELTCYAAERGNGSALGFLMSQGDFFHHNTRPSKYRDAFFWTCRCAIRGEPDAQSRLGAMYSLGKGTRPNDVMAVKWYRKAAEAGSPAAQFDLGHMYDWGLGIDRDFAEAAIWYRKAASVLPRAQAALAEMYAKGRGVRKDYLQAYMWAGLADAHGYTGTRRNDFRGELDREQIDGANQWIAQWNPFDLA